MTPAPRSRSSSSRRRPRRPRRPRSPRATSLDASRKRPLLLRPQGRPALRLRLGVHQVDARRRRRRGRLLPRGDARGGRGRPFHRAAHGHPRLRGRRQRRPERAGRRGRRRAGARARRPARGAAQPRAGGDLPGTRAQVERLRVAIWEARRDVREHGNARPPAMLRSHRATRPARRRAATARATSTRTTTRTGSTSRTSRKSYEGRRYYRPSGHGEERADDDDDG